MSDDAVLLVGHGTVTDLSEIPDFLRRIRRGRPASDELIEEVRRRYELVGGSPLLDLTRRQAALLERVLGLPVLVAMRMAEPLLETVVRGLASRPPARLIVLPAAPFSVHVYVDATARVVADLESHFAAVPVLKSVKPWGMKPAFLRAHVENIRPHVQAESALILTAHSLPTRGIADGDPYQEQFEQCARAIAEQLGCSAKIAYQSQGAGGGDWLGPDLSRVLRTVRASGVRKVVVAPVGFLTEHVETLYDLDVEARAWCDELGLEWVRVPALDTNSGLIRAMAEAVEEVRQ